MKSIFFTVKAPEGLNTRPAQLFWDTTNPFQVDIQVKNATEDSDHWNAKSLLSMQGVK